MSTTSPISAQLDGFYEPMTSLERIMRRLERDGVDLERLRTADLAERDIDCQNLGGHRMLTRIADVVVTFQPPADTASVLDVGCGIGGPGRYLVERFGCSVAGIDLLASRVEVAEALTDRIGLAARIGYHVADLRSLPFDDATFQQAWMLDVGIHVRDKQRMFAELARVLRPGGLLVMHDQIGPLGPAMRPITRRAPYIAPRLARLIDLVEASGLRLVRWHDTTDDIVEYFAAVRNALARADSDMSTSAQRRRQWTERVTTAYLTTLSNPDGRTGLLLAVRR